MLEANLFAFTCVGLLALGWFAGIYTDHVEKVAAIEAGCRDLPVRRMWWMEDTAGKEVERDPTRPDGLAPNP